MSRPPFLPTKESTENNMDLPDGMSCKQCIWFQQCSVKYGVIPEDRICDFCPSRFVI